MPFDMIEPISKSIYFFNVNVCMEKEGKQIYKEGIEQYSLSTVIFNNFLMFIWIALGTICCLFISPYIAFIYLSFTIIMVGFVLRELLCTNCYYYDKYCGLGWGKCTALFFKKGNIEEFSKSSGQKLAPATYGLRTLIPFVLVVASIFKEFTAFKIIVLVLLLLISIYSGTISRKKGCARCKMRDICPGSAAK